MPITCPHCGGTIETARKPKAPKKGGTVNPFGHPYPHARLYNNKLTDIGRLSKNCTYPTISNNDIRNYSISGKVPNSEEAPTA